jgi:ubiquinone biosynthesis O-methyltransferase
MAGRTKPGRESTVDATEVARFSALAAEWWDARGKMAVLHRLNPVRLGFIKEAACRHFSRNDKQLDALSGLRLLDIGCGGGGLSSFLCRYGEVTGIDLSRSATELAGLLEPRGRFEVGTIEEHRCDGCYDLVTLFDVVEHVPPADRGSLFEEMGRALTPGGWIVLSTPHPDFLHWVQQHRPELLQVVDEPVELAELIELAARIDRELVAYRSYQLDVPGARQYQFVVLAPPAARARDLYRPAPLHRLRARLELVANRRLPMLGRLAHAARLARVRRFAAAVWVLRLRRTPPPR